MIKLLTSAPAQIFAGEQCSVGSNRTGRGHIAIYAGKSLINQLEFNLSAPIIAGVCQIDIGQLLEQYATGLSIPLRNGGSIISALASHVEQSVISNVRIVASDGMSALDGSSQELFSCPLMHGKSPVPSGQMFMYRGIGEILRGAWALGHIAPMGVPCSLQVRALRDGGFTDIVQVGTAHIPADDYSTFCVSLQSDTEWRYAHTLEVSAVMSDGSIYKSISIPLRQHSIGDRQAYFRNTYGAFQPIVLHAWEEDCSIKYSSDRFQHQDTRKYSTGGAFRPVSYSATMKHTVKAVAGYYDAQGSTSVTEFMRSNDIYIADSLLLRRMVHAGKNSATVQSISDDVLSAECTLMDYNHNDIISTRYIDDSI